MARRALAGLSNHGGGGGGHDGGGMMRWLLTYADMITLLTAFFIMMYSMSVLNLNKFKQLALSVRSGFGGDLHGAGIFEDGGAAVLDNPDEIPDPELPLSAIRDQVDEYIKDHKLEECVTARMEERGLVISLSSEELLFQLGRAELRREARRVLDRMAELLSPIANEVLVEGHTCNLPIRTLFYPSNWELSTARATAVVRYLVTKKRLDPRRIGAAGYADSRPYVENSSEEQRRRNRRVDIVIFASEDTLLRNAQTAPATPPLGSSLESSGGDSHQSDLHQTAAHVSSRH